jgi:hypothetical protein
MYVPLFSQFSPLRTGEAGPQSEWRARSSPSTHSCNGPIPFLCTWARYTVPLTHVCTVLLLPAGIQAKKQLVGPQHHFEDVEVHPSLVDVCRCSLCGNPGISNTSSHVHETAGYDMTFHHKQKESFKDSSVVFPLKTKLISIPLCTHNIQTWGKANQ